MYDPVKDGVDKAVQSVSYIEIAAPVELADLVHCYWELKTTEDLGADFVLHALPDACVNVLFNQLDTAIAGVTALHTTHTTLNLGRSFHYVGVQFFPGVWNGASDDTVDHYVGEPYEGDLPLIQTNEALARFSFAQQAALFTEFVVALREAQVVAENPMTAAILRNINDVHSVTDMAEAAGLSPRQLQRHLKATTGFAPHDLLKVLRLQNSFRQDYLLSFADQAHFTHSFKDITGFTPGQFMKTFDV